MNATRRAEPKKERYELWRERLAFFGVFAATGVVIAIAHLANWSEDTAQAVVIAVFAAIGIGYLLLVKLTDDP